MKWISLFIGLAILGFGVQKYYLEPQEAAKAMAAAPPPPPPPPPLEEPPPPVIDEASMEKIRLSTKDTNPLVRWEAIQLMISAGTPEADTYLFDMLQRDTEADLRLRAVAVLKSRPGLKVSRALTNALKDSEPDVRLAALDAVSHREDINAAQFVGTLVSDSDERVRLAAIRALNMLNEKRARKTREAADRNAQAQKDYQLKMQEYEAAQLKAAEGRR
ncbi:MAG: HEAT repeat domain-containing protein [Elusimicrobia bacterium]|nr:HEAT repeat domain-containing protein [Elusimicrobiota bacterium]